MVHTHRDYEPFELAENMEEDLGLFEAAVQQRKIELSFGPLRTVGVICDGSHREATARQVGEAVARRLSATTSQLTRQAAEEQLTQPDSLVGLLVLPMAGDGIHPQGPAPSFDPLLTRLLRESASPVLCVPQPLDQSALGKLFESVLLAAARDDQPTIRALTWSVQLAAARIILVEAADEQSLAQANHLLQLQPEQPSVQQAVVGRAVNSRLGPLVGAAQRHGRERGLTVQVEQNLGGTAQGILSSADRHHCGLLIIPRPVDRAEMIRPVLDDLLVGSPRPVLVV